MSYYTRTKTFADFTLARGEADVAFEFDAVASAFDTVQTAVANLQGEISALQTGTTTAWGISLDVRWVLTAVSGTDTITATAPAGPASTDTLSDGIFFILEPVADNTGAVTLNLATSEGAEPIQKLVAGVWTNLDAGDLQANGKYFIIYDSSQGAWQLFEPKSSDTTASAQNIFNDMFLGDL